MSSKATIVQHHQRGQCHPSFTAAVDTAPTKEPGPQAQLFKNIDFLSLCEASGNISLVFVWMFNPDPWLCGPVVPGDS